ncbi:restriction endonuclease [Oceanobacillus massiliensis]|uniref:restriction endonuclease n=1 Tax=Oceanobacillus massiliensis TaxID=1465765 RepID=UPI000288CA00|nr:restriction endonuclease [Oceanobacillus massiliensis]
MNVLVLIIILLLIIIGGLIWYIKKRDEQEAAIIVRKIETSLELKRTMAMGLYYRFNFPRVKNDNQEIEFLKSTDLFLKQLPYQFEDFVVPIMKNQYGGHAFTTVKSGDYGIDFEHEREDGLYLGQVKAYKENLDFTPIALIHSNMVKRGAKGGYVVTTSNFSPAARKYAKDLNIELIDGIKLVTYWLEALANKVYESNEEFA